MLDSFIYFKNNTQRPGCLKGNNKMDSSGNTGLKANLTLISLEIKLIILKARVVLP